MSLGELQDCNCVARGCVRRSVLVFFSYAFMAATKMVRKLEEDADVEGGRDMVTSWSTAGNRKVIASMPTTEMRKHVLASKTVCPVEHGRAGT